MIHIVYVAVITCGSSSAFPEMHWGIPPHAVVKSKLLDPIPLVKATLVVPPEKLGGGGPKVTCGGIASAHAPVAATVSRTRRVVAKARRFIFFLPSVPERLSDIRLALYWRLIRLLHRDCRWEVPAVAQATA